MLSLELSELELFFAPLHPCVLALSFSYCKHSSGMAFCKAVALAEQSAEVVSFQRMQPNQPPTQNARLVNRSRKSASHFGGNNAKCATKESFRATNAVTTATFATFQAFGTTERYP